MEDWITELTVECEIEAMLPHSEQEYEDWARHEYPHIMWLYDLLQESFEYKGGWRKLLAESGEIYRFDYPASLDEPNVNPRLKSIQSAASAADFKAEVIEEIRGGLDNPSGIGATFALPDLTWADANATSTVISLRLTPSEQDVGLPILEDNIPAGYMATVVDCPDLSRRVLVYLTIANQMIEDPRFQYLSLTARNALESLQLTLDSLKRPSTNCVSYGSLSQIHKVFDLRSKIYKTLWVSENPLTRDPGEVSENGSDRKEVFR